MGVILLVSGGCDDFANFFEQYLIFRRHYFAVGTLKTDFFFFDYNGECGIDF